MIEPTTRPLTARGDEVSRYRKKPVVIEAVEYAANKVPVEDLPSWFWDALRDRTIESGPDDTLLIKTLEGTMTVTRGDWIIRGIKGELYPCKNDIFEATYEAIP